MPTLMGRFNELLHNFSSSNTNNNTATTINTNTNTNHHHNNHNHNHHSSSTTSRSSRQNNQSHGISRRPQQTHTSRNSATRNSSSSSSRRSSSDRPDSNSRRSSASSRSGSSSRVRSSSSSSSATKTSNHHHHSHHGSNSGKSRQYRASNGSDVNNCSSSSTNKNRCLNHSISSANALAVNSIIANVNKQTVNSSSSSSTNQKARQQNQSRHQRRHSIASISSMSNNNINKIQHVDSTATKILADKRIEPVMNMDLSKPVSSVNNENSCNTSHEMNDESSLSMLVRMMRIGKRNIHNNNNNNNNGIQIFHKKISKLTKKEITPNGNDSTGTFIHRYLDGHLTKQHPDIISGKTCYDMPVRDIELLKPNIIAACTGPSGGLQTVNCNTKPFELAIDDVDFIDEDYPDSSLSSNHSNNNNNLQYNTTRRNHNTSSPENSSTKLSITPHSLTSESPTSSTSSKNSSEEKLRTQSTDYVVEPVAGIENWNRSEDYAYGISTTLYEAHPCTKQKAGDPIADSYAICVRENSAILALADGVNWGEKACLASRCAVHGCIDYLNKALYSTAESTRSKNTMDIFVALLRSFNAAHNLILSQGGHLTTLCAAVICQLKDSDRFIVCTCNVGDSLAYVYSPSCGVREITQGSHDIFSMRDMRDALGALGPVSGSEPELNNLTVAMTIIDIGDIVFLTSDGISDNFDPVVGKFAIAKKEQQPKEDDIENGDKQQQQQQQNKANSNNKQSKDRKRVQRSNSNPERRLLNYTSKGLPLVSAQQRHELTLLRMEDLIMNGVNGLQQPRITAKELCSLLVDFSTKLTMAKRRILEDPELYSDVDEDGQQHYQQLDQLDISEVFDKQRRRRRLAGQRLAQVPGKLDHATIAAVEVGYYGSLRFKNKMIITKSINNEHSILEEQDSRYNLKLKPTLARFESQESLESINEAGPI